MVYYAISSNTKWSSAFRGYFTYCWERRGETHIYWVSEVVQSCPTLCDPVDCSQPGSSAHGILQARILEWIAIFFSRGSSRPRYRTQVSRIAGRRFNLTSIVDTALFSTCGGQKSQFCWNMVSCKQSHTEKVLSVLQSLLAREKPNLMLKCL